MHAGFHGLAVNRFVSFERCSQGRFAYLLVVAGTHCLWHNHCEGVAAGRRALFQILVVLVVFRRGRRCLISAARLEARRSAFPVLERLYTELLCVPLEELFFLGSMSQKSDTPLDCNATDLKV